MYPALILHYGRLSRRTIYFLAILLRETWPSGMKEIVLIRRGGGHKTKMRREARQKRGALRGGGGSAAITGEIGAAVVVVPFKVKIKHPMWVSRKVL